MSQYTFRSVYHPNIRFRIYDREDNNRSYRWSSTSCSISRTLCYFDTLGDGEVQHTSEMCPSNGFEMMRDVVISIMPHLALLDDENILQNAHRIFIPYRMPSAELLEFIDKKCKYDESKTVYVNLDDCKASTADSKAHDKRWVKVSSYWVDESWSKKFGRIRSVMHEMSEYKFLDPIQSIFLDIEIARHFSESACRVAQRYWDNAKEGHTIYRGYDQVEIESFLNRVEACARYLKARVEHDNAKGWLDRSYGYAIDKIKEAKLDKIDKDLVAAE